VDDGSSADEFRRIAEIASSGARMKLIRNPGLRRGPSARRNAGLAASRGEYVVFLDGDDALAPNCLQRRVEVMRSDPKVDFTVFPASVLASFLETPGSSGTNSHRKMISTDFFVSTYPGIRLVQFREKPASGKRARGMIAFSPRKTGSFTFVPSRLD
jgi:glycosyltransferase involved in cell wall biosynthesis